MPRFIVPIFILFGLSSPDPGHTSLTTWQSSWSFKTDNADVYFACPLMQLQNNSSSVDCHIKAISFTHYEGGYRVEQQIRPAVGIGESVEIPCVGTGIVNVAIVGPFQHAYIMNANTGLPLSNTVYFQRNTVFYTLNFAGASRSLLIVE